MWVPHLYQAQARQAHGRRGPIHHQHQPRRDLTTSPTSPYIYPLAMAASSSPPSPTTNYSKLELTGGNGDQEGRRGGAEADTEAVLEPGAAAAGAEAGQRVGGGGGVRLAVRRAEGPLRGVRRRAAAAVRGAPRASRPAGVPLPAPPRRGGVRLRRRRRRRPPRPPLRGGRLPLPHLLPPLLLHPLNPPPPHLYTSYINSFFHCSGKIS